MKWRWIYLKLLAFPIICTQQEDANFSICYNSLHWTRSTLWPDVWGLSHITQVHQWTPKWCPTVQFSSDVGQVSGTQAESSVLTDLHSSGSVRGKYRQPSSKTPRCKLTVLSTTSLSSAVGQRVLGIQESTFFFGLLYRILPETLITTRGKRFTGEGIETRVSLLLSDFQEFSNLEILWNSYRASYNLKFPSSSQKIG